MSGNSQGSRVITVEVAHDRDGQRLDNFLSGRLKGVPRSLIYRIIRTGQVRVNGGRAKPMQKLQAGDRVRIPPVRFNAAEAPRVPEKVVQQLEAAVIHEDADLLACNKPAGMAVHSGSGIRWGVIDAFRQSRTDQSVELVHRLDRDTSGVLLLAKNRAALKHLQSQFEQRTTRKRYLTLLHGRLPEDKVIVDQPLAKQERGGERFTVVDDSGKPAITEFRRLETLRDGTFAEALPVTGRTHQIRAHALWLDQPCAGDERYSSAGRLEFWRNQGLNRLFLHAHALEFEALNGEPMHVSCELPDELRLIIDRL
jgi:23S rRNA pseudouridine955/2504/2580 synthase